MELTPPVPSVASPAPVGAGIVMGAEVLGVVAAVLGVVAEVLGEVVPVLGEVVPVLGPVVSSLEGAVQAVMSPAARISVRAIMLNFFIIFLLFNGYSFIMTKADAITLVKYVWRIL